MKQVNEMVERDEFTGAVLRMDHWAVSKEIIDITFQRLYPTVNNGGENNVSFRIVCGGMSDYRPAIRFVLDTENNKWDLVSNSYVSVTKQ